MATVFQDMAKTWQQCLKYGTDLVKVSQYMARTWLATVS